jgi:molecular chaperone GrpE (heat shock protein)
MPDEDHLHVATEAAPAPAPAEPEADRAAALRALRNLEATEARVSRNAKRETEEAKGKLVMELLPVLDNLDRTIDAAARHGGDPTMLEGVRMVRAQLEGVLGKYGVETIDATGQRFDPAIHEAIGVAPVADPRANGVVMVQHQPGYQFGGRLLRPARVLVGKYAAPSLPRVPRPYWQ